MLAEWTDSMCLQLTPQLLKSGVTMALLELLAPIQAEFQASQEWQDIEKKAYPPPEPPKKKVKKPKDKGSRHPGAAKDVDAKPDGTVEGPGKAEVNVGTGVDDAMKELAVGEKN